MREGLSETKAAFDQLTAWLEPSFVEEWTAQEQIAMDKHGDALKIYDVALRESFRHCSGLADIWNEVQTLSEIQFKLLETEVHQGNLSGAFSLVTEGFGIEKSQYVDHSTDCHQGINFNYRMLLTADIKSLGKLCLVAEKNRVLDRQCRLEARIASYEHCMSFMMRLENNTQWAKQHGRIETPMGASSKNPKLYQDR